MSRISELLDRYSLVIALLAAWIAMLGSLYFSQVRGYIPCELCWYQRILMYPLTLLLAIGLLRKDENLPLLVLPLSSFGLLIALYHYLLEKTNIFPAHVCSAGVSCTTTWINWFGFMTIPFLSLVAFTIITLMSVIAWQAGEPANDEESQSLRLPVGAIVVVGAMLFIALFTTDNRATAQAIRLPVAGGQVAAVDGQQLYMQGCASCHGQKAEGVAGLGTAFTDSDFVKQSTDDELLAMIRNGRGLDDPLNTSKLVMPPSGGRPDLSDEQMRSVIQVIRGFQ